MLFAVYNLFTTLALFLVAPYHLYRSFSRGHQPALAERFGWQQEGLFAPLAGHQVFWVHAEWWARRLPPNHSLPD